MFNIKNLFSSVKRVWPWVKAHKIWSVVIAVVFIIIVFLIASGGESSLAAKTSEVKVGTVAQEVSVTGRVKGSEAVNLSFERSGRATWIPAVVGAKVRQGQTLVQLDAGETVAQRQQAQAAVMSAQAKYDQLLAGARQEDVNVLRSTLNTSIAQAADTTRTAAAVGMNSLVTLTDIQYSYTYFNDNSTSAVQLAFAKEQALYALYSEQNLGRVQPWYFTPLASGLKGRIDQLQAAEGVATVGSSIKELRVVLDKVLYALRAAQSTIYGQPSVLETDKTRLQAAIDSMLAQQQALTGAEGGMRDAKARLDLKIASPESYDVITAQSQLEQAKASLALVDAQLAKYTLRAPFAGTVTSIDVTRGEVVSPSAPIVSLIGNGNFEIEANISEAD
ncbi:MAG: HlyD family efflux transporter periplasmic adaptor subunit, partial [Patescibacteria group bacterium]